MKTLDTLVEDIYALFDPDQHHELNENNLEEFAQNLKQNLRQRFAEYTAPESPLRFSALGKQNRQVWYEAHPVEGGKEPMLPKTYLKFLYGDILEQLLVLLAKEAGHAVEMQQAEVEVDGVKGHIDCKIDGVLIDVKSASPYGYKKFETNTVPQDDAFGYVAQLSGYANVLTPGQKAAWLAINKVDGDICVSYLPEVVIKHNKPEDRISELKTVINMEQPPERCYEPVPDGKSGNFKLPTPCSYCSHKFRCHSDLRAFAYSSGPRYLTKVVREPEVPEITQA
jgi:hypothetical protein